MNRKEKILLIISEILEEKDFKHMSDIELHDIILLVKDVLDKIEEEPIDMLENAESKDKIQDAIIILKEIYLYLLKYEREIKKNNENKLTVRDLNEKEEYEERYNLRIPKKTILLQENNSKTR